MLPVVDAGSPNRSPRMSLTTRVVPAGTEKVCRRLVVPPWKRVVVKLASAFVGAANPTSVRYDGAAPALVGVAISGTTLVKVTDGTVARVCAGEGAGDPPLSARLAIAVPASLFTETMIAVPLTAPPPELMLISSDAWFTAAAPAEATISSNRAEP